MANHSFTFTPDDMKCITKIKASMEKAQGKVSIIAAIRVALRGEAGRLGK